MSNPRSLGNLTANFMKANGLMNAVKPETKPEAPKEYAHPILTKENFRQSIENYQRHVQKHNMRVWMDNAQVRDYNKEVIRHRRNTIVDIEQKIKEESWKAARKKLPIEAYNAAVEQYNEKNGPQLRKKNVCQEVKPLTEKFFIAFLHQYNMQLFKRKNMRASLGVHVPGELPKLDLYPNKIIENERNGCKNLPVSAETVCHHRKRMEEAGVLLDYQFRGPNRAIKIAFNPEILALTDNGMPKNRATDNQGVTKEIANKVKYNNVSSREHLSNKSKIRDKGNDFSEKEKPLHLDCTKKTTKAPKAQSEEKNDAQAKNLTGAKKDLTLSQVLGANITEKSELARELSAGKHADYEHLSPKIMQQEAYYGTLHPEDLKELAIADIFKFLAPIFANLPNVHPGSWMNALKLWDESKFCGPTGKTLSKPNVFERWHKIIQIAKEVKKFKTAHPEWIPHYPSLYFDPARSFKENNSFEYAYRNFRLDETKTESFRRRKAKAFQSLRQKTDVKKAQLKTREFLNGKISMDQLFDYVRYNCSPAVNENINTIIKKEIALANE